MKYLVTGGAGFIGSHLVDKLLENGHQVRVLDNLISGKRENIPSECEFFLGDITNTLHISAAMDGIDGCFHLAAIPSVQEYEQNFYFAHKTNFNGSINVLYECAKNNIPIVYASSAAVYGDNIIKERLNPKSFYGLDKLSLEKYANMYSRACGMKSLGFRFFNVYGPRQDPKSPYSGVISKFVENVKNDLPITIYGDGKQSRDFIHVYDIVEGLYKGMKYVEDYDGTTTLNIDLGTGNNISIYQLADIIYNVLDKDLPMNIEWKPCQKDDIKHSVADTKYTEEIFGKWSCMSLGSGLLTLIEKGV